MPQEKTYFVYIVTNKPHGTLYVGVTSNLLGRTWQHKEKTIEGFTKKYNCSHLVYYEAHENPESAIRREKRLKHWIRRWKIDLIQQMNPDWLDLFEDGVRSSGQAGG